MTGSTRGGEGAGALTQVVFHVLLALADGPLHGYAIMKRIERDAGVAMGPGTVYGSLGRLSDQGWVREAVPARETDGRRGRAFELTDDGRAALVAEVARISRLAGMKRVRDLAPESGA
jgi:DNA-binding PadR family transcriptional regulator